MTRRSDPPAEETPIAERIAAWDRMKQREAENPALREVRERERNERHLRMEADMQASRGDGP